MAAGRPSPTASSIPAKTGLETSGKRRSQDQSLEATEGRSQSETPLQKAEAEIQALKAQLAAAHARIDELQAWADTDFLLNIYNRRGFERELGRASAYIDRYRATAALIVLDVDRLKPINDTYGHAAGDMVLKGVVAVLMRHIRSSDVVGRLGGDEFAMLLWNLSEGDARAKALALEQAIDSLTFMFKGHAVTVGASAGVAMLKPLDDAALALEQADQAMYVRKAERKDTTISSAQAMMSGVI
jgi:diguanylate cyclase (GGDEF)-like protein